MIIYMYIYEVIKYIIIIIININMCVEALKSYNFEKVAVYISCDCFERL